MKLLEPILLSILLVTLPVTVFSKSVGSSDFGDCNNVVVMWEKKTWGPDLEGHVLVKAKGSPALADGWSVTIELDQPVTQCVDYNANMTKARKNTFKHVLRNVFDTKIGCFVKVGFQCAICGKLPALESSRPS